MTSIVEPPTSDSNGRMTAVPAPVRPPLGEELPIFCERCGYNLNGLPQARCDHCDILQFHCPECGHHQPINTLRPAFQRVLGRVRAFVLGAFVFFKINFFFWLLFAWVGMGLEWSYRYNHEGVRSVIVSGKTVRQLHGPQWIPHPMTTEMVIVFCVLAAAFGMIGRMLLLRWRTGWCVGLIMAILATSAILLGAQLSRLDQDDRITISPLTADFLTVTAIAGLVIVAAATLVWPIWVMLIHVFLPRPWAKTVLDWQTFRPARVTTLASS